MNFIQDTNLFFASILPCDIWNYLEMVAGCLVFVGCIMQRANAEVFRTDNILFGKFHTKIGQFGLYCQMMIGLITVCDAYFNFQSGNCHTLMALWAISSALVKYNVYVNLNSVRSARITDLT